jgi:streptogramin lyase
VSDPLVILGSGFGSRDPASRLEFVYGEETVSVVSTNSEIIDVWDDGEISVHVPDAVDTGTLRVIAGGQPSAPVEFVVYEYNSFDIPPQQGTNAYGNALAVAGNGKIWMNREFHRFLQASFLTLVSIPQADGLGIFASMIFGDQRTRTSVLGEDVAVDSQGNVWFSEGGELYYPGKGNNYDYKVDCDPINDPDCHYCVPNYPPFGTCKTATVPAQYYNTSRVVKYNPTNNQFSCFNSPMDNSEIVGVLVDEGRKIVWYAEGGVAKDLSGNRSGNAITGIKLDDNLSNSTLSNCLFDPYSDQRDQLCANGPAENCHWRFALPVENEVRSPAHLALDQNGNIWFTEFWGNRIGRLNPGTGQIIELPLPPTINTDPNSPAALFGSGPWELDFDSSGNLWVTEYFDATILKIDPSLMGTEDCLQLTNGQNPCITEVYHEGGNPPAPDAAIHTLDIAPDGKIWFVVSKDPRDFGSRKFDTVGQVGFINPAPNSAAVLLPVLKSQYDSSGNVVVDGIGEAAGVVVNPPKSGDIYFMESSERQLGRLRLGLCAQNAPYQIGNGVGIPGDDATVPNSDPFDTCDSPDADHDGLPDASDPHPGGDITYDDNNNGIMCPTDPADNGPSWDFNCNGKRDGMEGSCPLAVNPRGDDDGDGLLNTWEVCKWGTDPTVIDSDGDGRGDCQEAADVDGNGVVNYGGDAIDVAKAALLPCPGSTCFGKDGDFDIDGNSVVDFADALQVAKFALISGLCK